MQAIVRVKSKGKFGLLLMNKMGEMIQEIDVDDVMIDDASGVFVIVSDGYHAFIEEVINKE